MFLSFILWNFNQTQCATQFRNKLQPICELIRKPIAKGGNSQPAFRKQATDFTLLDSEKPAYGLGGFCAENQQISAGSECLDGLPGCKIV
jgi:hypothetical protein